MSAVPSTISTNKLIDKFGRQVTYVRISVTDRCDFRCVYCMSEDMEFLPREQVLTFEEISLLSRAFVEMGVTKIRITGGEPLVRKDVVGLLAEIAQLDGLDELVITTNGSQLVKLAQPLKDAGVKRINISLDSLDADKFKKVTRVGDLDVVLKGIQAAKAAGFEKIKLNAVILKNRNHDEVNSLVQYAMEEGLDISFIEEMPLGAIDSHSREEAYYSSDEIKSDIETKFELLPSTKNTGGPARYYSVNGYDNLVGFISPHSHNFCDTCNRVRVTASGLLLLCLGQEHSMDLKSVLRENPNDLNKIKLALIESMDIKPEGHEFDITEQPVIFRHMSVTGG
ncbi:MAG: cyclic pyranopterin phosphate synthase [Cycloclasticus sp. symbiont of Bathymodiolus heckerae]|nr:MAG: cyclic pyranopterin phosphate synthase [Cycloclasticus sp. symbiont of Bathymodiolus heckerae]